MLKEAMERAFGPVDTVSLRRKGAGKHSWAFVTMHNHDSVLREARCNDGGLELARSTIGEAHRCAARFESALRGAGWDVESACHLEDAHSRIVFVSPDDADCDGSPTVTV